jgi:hypothetical protein
MHSVAQTSNIFSFSTNLFPDIAWLRCYLLQDIQWVA